MPWHEPLISQVQSQAEAGRLAHAYLLRGPEGVGKQQLAEHLGNWLLCERSTEQPCGACRSCLLLNAGTHPDLLQVFPEARGKQIKISQIRQLITFAGKTAQMGGRRVIVLGPAEAMNVNAANALLKVLEEPGADTQLLLFSHQLGEVLPTLRSRCQVLYQPLPEQEEAELWLESQTPEQHRSDRQLAYYLAGQRPLLALEYLEGQQLRWRERMVVDLAQVTKGKLAPVAVAARWQDLDAVTVLDWLSRWVADMVRFSACGDEQLLGPEDSRAMLRYIAEKSGARRLLDFYQQLLDWLRVQRTQGSLNKQLLIETIIIQWLHLTVSAT